ncbi:MAG: tetratricopeptide repeat protein [Chloroflexi bacterium]|nr:tetratricopeptide repeat protein [Chloroflexota bacterium]
MKKKGLDYSIIFMAAAFVGIIAAFFIFGPGKDLIKTKKGIDLDNALRLMNSGDLTGAEEQLQAALEADPENPEVYLMMGDLLMAKGHLQGAIFYFEQARVLKPGAREPVIRFLLPLFLLGESQRGVELLQELAEADPRNPMNYLDIANMKTELAASLRADKKPWTAELENGRRYLDQALALDAGIKGAELVEAKLALLGGDSEAARRHFKAEFSRPDLVDPALKIDIAAALGLLTFQAGGREEAREYFKQATDMFDKWNAADYQRTLHNRELFLLVREVFFGDILTSQKLRSFYPEYDELLKKGIFAQLKHDQARGLFLAILDAREKGSIDKAIDLAVHLNRDFGDPAQPQCFFHNFFFRPLFKTVTYILLGDLQLKAGKKNGARKSYNKALEFSPGNPAVIERLKKL